MLLLNHKYLDIEHFLSLKDELYFGNFNYD